MKTMCTGVSWLLIGNFNIFFVSCKHSLVPLTQNCALIIKKNRGSPRETTQHFWSLEETELFILIQELKVVIILDKEVVFIMTEVKLCWTDVFRLEKQNQETKQTMKQVHPKTNIFSF